MRAILSLSFLLLLVLISCGPDEEPIDCVNTNCSSFSYAFIDKDTFENLVGREPGQFNPDSIYFLTDEGDTMPRNVNYRSFSDWWEVSFLYQDELMRCDLFETDSTFTLTYYIHLGTRDVDTLDIRIAPCRDPDAVFFNGSDDVARPNVDEIPSSTFYLRK